MRRSLRSIVTWLRAGYPSGVPQEDYIALFGVLQRHLTESEIVTLVERLRAHRGAEPLSRADIRAAAKVVLKGHATEEDVRRVAARLAAVGWPVAETMPSGDLAEHTMPGGPRTGDAGTGDAGTGDDGTAGVAAGKRGSPDPTETIDPAPAETFRADGPHPPATG